MLFTVVQNLFALILKIGPGATQIAIYWAIAYVVVLVGLVLKLLAARMYLFGKDINAGPIKRLLPVIQTIGIALWAVSMLSNGRPGIFLCCSICLQLSLLPVRSSSEFIFIATTTALALLIFIPAI